MPDRVTAGGTHLMYLDSVSWVDMHGLQHCTRCVGANGNGTQVKGPVLLPNLLEHPTVPRVTSKPEALCFAQDCPATPEALVLIIPGGARTGVLQGHDTSGLR